MKFALKQYDMELISFDLRLDELDGFVCTALKKSEKNRRLFSSELEISERTLLDWLKSRVIPRNYNLSGKCLKAPEVFQQGHGYCPKSKAGYAEEKNNE